MSAVIFVGPSLDSNEVEIRLRARWLPPVRYGDLFRAVSLFRPRLVGIIDGYFNQVPAVWHKEVLWAMKQGVQVFGAASMGALRAAELDRYGMKGIGEIYAAYRDGTFPPYDDLFEDDDEVAVVHGPAELGYPAASEALVNIRATLAAAAREGIISPTARDRLVGRSKERFYPERSFETVIADAVDTGLPRDQVDGLQAWIGENKINQKRRDALSLLQHLAADDDPPVAADFRFEHTTLWENATSEFSRLPAVTGAVLDELRLLGSDYFELREEVTAEVFYQEEGRGPDTGGPDEPDSWFEEAFRDRELESFVRSAPPHWLERRMLARVAASGDLETLERRAADKQRRLEPSKGRAADLSELELLELMDWYFGRQLGREMPGNMDDYVAALGGLDVEEFYDLVLKEYWYLHPES